VPIAVNALFDVTHLPAIYGSHALAGAVVSADAEVISALGPDLGHILTLGELARL
jgi:Asp-tRNA(Asn)/Glu-tRNA(Gln) amidotransferase A subunit family amidase